MMLYHVYIKLQENNNELLTFQQSQYYENRTSHKCNQKEKKHLISTVVILIIGDGKKSYVSFLQELHCYEKTNLIC